MAQLVARSTVSKSVVGSNTTRGTEHLVFPPPMLRDWVIKGLGMSSRVNATGHINDPVPLIEKRRGLSPGGGVPPSFIHQVIIITGLNNVIQLYVLALKMASDADWAQNPYTQTRTYAHVCISCQRKPLTILFIRLLWGCETDVKTRTNIHYFSSIWESV